MKFTQIIAKEVEVKYVRVDAYLRHVGNTPDDDVTPDFPLLVGDSWRAVINIESGVILGWPRGEERTLFAKVCDGGSYYLLDEEENVVASKEEDYVPNLLIPGKWGDYIDLEIDQFGKIINWPSNPRLSEFEQEDV